METNGTVETRKSSNLGGLNAPVTIIILILISAAVFHWVFGNPDNFEGGDVAYGHPKNFLGIIHKGGVIIPFLMSFFLMVLVFGFDRLFALKKASGKGNTTKFVEEIRAMVEKNQIDDALALCDEQRGSLGNVVREGLVSYKALSTDTTMNKEQKLAELNKVLGEAMTLEMPGLEKNTAIISTIATIGTLIALMGTVIGMIKAFFALGEGGGTPDAAKLSVGIAEALINTGMGIGASALAIIVYNLITNHIDNLTFKIDEIGMSIQQAFAAHH
ncbi:MAG: MotA/TolQ/ExbB proton channel family protein [Weeksellaceae bacterium]